MSPPVLQYPLDLGGVTSRMLECGSGSETVLCLHGAGSRADRWRPVMEHLAEAGLHVLAPDLPGHGLAEKPAGHPYGARAFTDAVLHLLDRAERPVTIIGTSLGGHVAAWAATRRPEAVRAVVLVAAVGLVPWERTSAPPIVDPSEDGVRAKLHRLLHDPSRITDAWVREESLINRSPGAAAALAELGRYAVEEAPADLVGDRFAELGLPAMVVWGEEDAWVPVSVGFDVSALLPDAPMVLLKDCGHAPYVERPEAFVGAVLPFLVDPTGQPPGSRRI